MLKQLTFMGSSVWDVTLCQILNSYRRFVRLHCLALKDEVLLEPEDGSSTIF
jgi:hypothetical protein